MDNLDNLLYWRGITSDYFNYRGEKVEVSLDNRLRLLRAMGVDTSDTDQLQREAFELDVAPWQEWLPPFVVSVAGGSLSFRMNLAPEELTDVFEYTLTLECGGKKTGQIQPNTCQEVGDYQYDGVRYSRREIELPSLPLGYHHLHVHSSNASSKGCECELVVVPKQAFTPTWVEEGARPWGIIVQLYTLRSARNWGIGDFSDLTLLIEEAAAAGADMVGLNPLHALRSPVEHHCSPYSPSDRRFLSPLYIDPELVPEYCKNDSEILPYLVRLRAADKVPYATVARVKSTVFQEMYAVFVNEELERQSPRANLFLRFVSEQGHALTDFCLYQVLSETTGQQLEDLSPDERANAQERYQEKVQYHAYLQWVAQEQLAHCQRRAKELGMKVGLMRDLAVGADGGGAEVSTNLELFCRDAAVGAPPDPLAEQGQNWGLPPMDPATLRKSNFEHFINLLRANMSHCGALRIDHAMALMRLWWCPPGHTADYGAYV